MGDQKVEITSNTILIQLQMQTTHSYTATIKIEEDNFKRKYAHIKSQAIILMRGGRKQIPTAARSMSSIIFIAQRH